MLLIVFVCSKGRWVCLVPGPFWDGYAWSQVPSRGWVCLVHPLEDTTPGGNPQKVYPQEGTPQKVHPSKVHTPVLTPNGI